MLSYAAEPETPELWSVSSVGDGFVVRVRAPRNGGEVRIILHPGDGFVNGGAPRDPPFRQIPRELRMPNTPLWVKLDDNMDVVSIWRRIE